MFISVEFSSVLFSVTAIGSLPVGFLQPELQKFAKLN